MITHDQIREAARKLASGKAYDKITFADVAAAAGVHWTSVRRCFGGKEQMRKWLADIQEEDGAGFADTRSRILDAAAEVFTRSGFAGATLDQVAAAADMTKGAVYWHFSGKHELFLELCERSLAAQLRVLPAQAHSALASEDPIESIALCLMSQLECGHSGKDEQDPSMLFFEFVVSSRDPSVREMLNQAYSSIIEGTSAIFQEMQDNGLLKRNIAPQALATLFQALIYGMQLTRIIDRNPDRLRSGVTAASQVLWQGLEPESGPFSR